MRSSTLANGDSRSWYTPSKGIRDASSLLLAEMMWRFEEQDQGAQKTAGCCGAILFCIPLIELCQKGGDVMQSIAAVAERYSETSTRSCGWTVSRRPAHKSTGVRTFINRLKAYVMVAHPCRRGPRKSVRCTIFEIKGTRGIAE